MPYLHSTIFGWGYTLFVSPLPRREGGEGEGWKGRNVQARATRNVSIFEGEEVEEVSSSMVLISRMFLLTPVFTVAMHFEIRLAV